MRINKSVILIASLLTTACGYHLRGAYDLPTGMKTIFLQGGSPALREQLNAVLKSSSGRLAVSPEKADIVLRIFKDGIERRALSLSERGRSNEIELEGHLEFEVLDAKNGVLVAREPINFRREYFNDQQAVIAKDIEETVIRNEMYQQVVRTIINRGRSAVEAKGK
ncbi:LPS assembly lipoprotein LptE [Methyloglobulus sp.]|uniref:LPS-assembly lipoprotein LptE n=1 Tax=Methyloglobulus sp. TaxID=2518622 RepID=UPI0039892D00